MKIIYNTIVILFCLAILFCSGLFVVISSDPVYVIFAIFFFCVTVIIGIGLLKNADITERSDDDLSS